MSLIVDTPLPAPPQPPASVGGLDWFSQPGDTIFAVADAALSGAGLDEVIARRARVFGEPSVQAMSQHANGQMYVWWSRTIWGKAGQEQYQWAGGEIGKFMFRAASYTLRVALPWPIQKGATPPRTDQMATSTRQLEQAASAVWAAFQAVLGGGYSPRPQQLVTDGLMMGPAEPIATRGGMAGFDIPFLIQL